MTDRSIAMLIAVGLSAGGVLADALLKLASKDHKPYVSGWFLGGTLLYAMLAFGWVRAMKTLNLASIGIIYSLCTVVFLTAVGVWFFHEKLHWHEIVGLLLAMAAMILLARFG